MKIAVSNPVLSDAEKTHITTDYSTGTNIYVRNSEGFTTDWYVIVGEPGQEQTEEARITGTSGGNTITISSALTYSHPRSTPVYLSQYDQISFERQPSGGSFSEISSSPSDIEWDDQNLTSTIVVSGGATSDNYRWRFYSSALSTYSDYSDTLAGTGFERATVGYVIQQVKRNSIAKDIEDEVILDYMNDYQTDVVYPEIPKAFWFTKEGTQLATAASDYTYSVSDNWSDFRSMKFLLYRYVSGSNDIKYPLTFTPTQEFYNLKMDSNAADDDNVKYWTLLPPDSSSALGYIGLHPTPETANCYIQPVYHYELTDLDSFGDTLVVPYPKGYIDYVLYRIFDDIKSNERQAEKYNRRVATGIKHLKGLARRQLGQPELFRYRGHRGWSRQFGEQSRLDSSTARELYW